MKGLSREQALYETLRTPFAPPFPSELIEAEMRDRRKREGKKTIGAMGISVPKGRSGGGGALDANKDRSRG